MLLVRICVKFNVQQNRVQSPQDKPESDINIPSLFIYFF